MIQPLRNAHRATFLLLGIGLPVLLGAAITSRNINPLGPMPARKEWTTVRPLGELYFHSGGQRVSLQLTRLGAYNETRQYVLAPTRPFASPELLLYWSPTEANGMLPASALLIGRVEAGREFSLPEGRGDKGFLLLYDAPHKKLLAAFPLEQR